MLAGSGVSAARPRAPRHWCWLQAVGWGAAGRKVSRPLAQVSGARSPYLSLSCRAGPSQISEGCLSLTRGFPRPSPEEFAIPNNGSFRWWFIPRESGCLKALCMLKNIPSASPRLDPTLYDTHWESDWRKLLHPIVLHTWDTVFTIAYHFEWFWIGNTNHLYNKSTLKWIYLLWNYNLSQQFVSREHRILFCSHL